MRAVLLALTIAFAGSTMAQVPSDPPGKPDASRVVGGHYSIEPRHTQVGFSVMHWGITPFRGVFSEASGWLDIDPAKPSAAKLIVTVPTATALVTVPKLTDELRSPMFFDPAKYPVMTFVSDTVVVHGQRATIVGKLTLHGVTRPLTLQASLAGAGTLHGKHMVGFTATGALRRSDFGITAALPLVSDDVNIEIAAAFEQPA